ncbi:MAG: hypothetical protein QY309_09355 [Cyclobacteriaceae bacterium]|nr:MAG: hypothetical protein QY309_09355 [Cyclobacteriaceae bacterium]
MRLINSILTVLFIVLAATHIQVVDAWKWVLLFGAMSVLSVMAIFELFFNKVLLIMFVGLLAWSFFLFPKSDEMSLLQTDFAKVILCLLVLILFLLRSRWYNSKRARKE